MKNSQRDDDNRYDYIIIGSGFGGSVSAYRLAQKGYRVLVVEKGRRYRSVDLSTGTKRPHRWLWMPLIGMRGIMAVTVLRHVTVMHGVGVGGGSLVYGATLPTPKDAFFNTGSWAGLNDWKKVLEPHYETALTMLGARPSPRLGKADLVLRDLAVSMGREDSFEHTRVGIFFNDEGKPNQAVADPYFDGQGPPRRGCIQCGDCMTGCQYGAKNSLDKNYLYLAEKLGTRVQAETEVSKVRPAGAADGSQGYFVTTRSKGNKARVIRTRGIVFSGGVMGTVKLLLQMRHEGSLPRLSEQLGKWVRTNNETLSSVTATGDNPNFNDGVTIASIFHPDDHSHLEPIRLGRHAGLWRLLVMPMATGRHGLQRLGSCMRNIAADPINTAKAWFARDFGPRTICLLFMQHLDSSISFERGRLGFVRSAVQTGQVAPSADIPLSGELTQKAEKIIGGKAMRSTPEALLGSPTTAHILGGAVMGDSAETGVIDQCHRVFGYQNMMICDGSVLSANPGVNPSLSITALSEWAMSHVPDAKQRNE